MKRDLTLIVDLLSAVEDATEANEHINVLDVLNVPALQEARREDSSCTRSSVR